MCLWRWCRRCIPGHVEAHFHVALRGEIVYFVGFHLPDYPYQRRRVGEVAVVQGVSRRLLCMSRTHSSRYRCSMRPVLNDELRRIIPCTS